MIFKKQTTVCQRANTVVEWQVNENRLEYSLLTLLGLSHFLRSIKSRIQYISIQTPVL